MKSFGHPGKLPYKPQKPTIDHTVQALLEFSITPRRKSGGRVVNMKVDLPLPYLAKPRCSSSTTLETSSGDDYRLRSLHRSKPVYSHEVFNHSIAARNSQPSHVSSSQLFMKKAAVWASKQSIPSPSQSFSHCGRHSTADLPVEKSRDLPILWPSSQLISPEAMQDLFQSSDFQQQCEHDSRERPTSPWTGVNWLQSTSGAELNDQQPADILPQSDLLHYEEPLGLEQPISQSQIDSQYSYNPWSLQTRDTTFCRRNVQDSTGRPDAGGFSDPNTVPLLSVPSSQRYTFPLTPPSSTPSNGASPNSEAAGGHPDFLNNAPQVSVDLTTPFVGLPSIQSAVLTTPTTPQGLPAELTWSSQEFASLFETDPFLTNMNSLHQTSEHQALLDISWQQETIADGQRTREPSTQPQQGKWRSHALHEPAPSSSYQSFTFDPLDEVNAFTNSAGITQNMGFDVMAPSFQADNSTTISSLFDGISPDVDLGSGGRKNGVKGHQRATAKDRQLIEWKNQGLSYKEIKARGGFDEAESTLRGRYRTLTKPKHLRVRKPEWQSRDVEILLEAVDHHLQDHTEEHNVREPFLTEAQRRASKIPWKQVAEYMEKRGCYRYGNATVKKKYLKVMANSFDL